MKLPLVVIAAVLIAVALAGCGSPDRSANPTSAVPPSAVGSSTASMPSPPVPSTTASVASSASATEPTNTGAGDQGAADAFHLWVNQTNAHQWRDNYAFLVPEQQQLITEDQFIVCRTNDSTAIPFLEWNEVLGIEHEPTDIPGTSITEDSAAVTAKVTVGGSPQSVTAHMFRRGDRWTWSLEQQAFDNCS